MKPPSLRVRIFAALTLSPMTTRELSRCLDRPTSNVAHMLGKMMRDGSVWICRHDTTHRRQGGLIPRVYAATQVAP